MREWVPLCYKCHEILDKRVALNDPSQRERVVKHIEAALEEGLWP